MSSPAATPLPLAGQVLAFTFSDGPWCCRVEVYLCGCTFVVPQFYQTEVNNEHVIRGNAAILKCVIPSFVADFVSVAAWVSDDGNTYLPSSQDVYVVHQQYETDVNKEHVIRGNSAIFKCVIPSFVADFVTVTSWTTSDGDVFYPSRQYVVFQPYDSDVNKEYVIRGNSAIMKCSIPSFVADFVSVTAWVTDQGEIFYPSDRYGKQPSEYLLPHQPHQSSLHPHLPHLCAAG
ncbi:hypothetical protein E2C01_059970 [Portunus trituberculatus]|uniref:Ig-like domain-containing protein n=1 Tax=Portunus trituberculatus TaxID=210409 RepID=A0A5B7H6U3_PORTR|nr:hypothetical protein [Portunus trituberculatus]